MKQNCTKQKYITKDHADFAIEFINKERKSSKLKYSYLCDNCGRWHVTSEKENSTNNLLKDKSKEIVSLKEELERLRSQHKTTLNQNKNLRDKLNNVTQELEKVKYDLSVEKDRSKNYKKEFTLLKEKIKFVYGY